MQRPINNAPTATTTRTRYTTYSATKKSRFEQLFTEQLQCIYWGEKALVLALPKMRKAATSEKLKDIINNHLDDTLRQVQRLEAVFGLLEQRAEAKECEVIAALINEANETIEETEEDSMVRNAALIIATKKIEHYEIAAYGSLCALATKMDYPNVSGLLKDSLKEEKAADSALTNLSVSINEEAARE